MVVMTAYKLVDNLADMKVGRLVAQKAVMMAGMKVEQKVDHLVAL